MGSWLSRAMGPNGMYTFLQNTDPPGLPGPGMVNWLADWAPIHGGTHPAVLTGSVDPRFWAPGVDGQGNETAVLKPVAELREIVAGDKIDEINSYARAVIAQGYSYGGVTFSLSDDAQRNLLDLRQSAASLTWPMTVYSMDDSESLVLQDATDGLAYYNAAWDAIRGARSAANAKKALVKAALDDPDPAAGLAAIQAITVP